MAGICIRISILFVACGINNGLGIFYGLYNIINIRQSSLLSKCSICVHFSSYCDSHINRVLGYHCPCTKKFYFLDTLSSGLCDCGVVSISSDHIQDNDFNLFLHWNWWWLVAFGRIESKMMGLRAPMVCILSINSIFNCMGSWRAVNFVRFTV